MVQKQRTDDISKVHVIKRVGGRELDVTLDKALAGLEEARDLNLTGGEGRAKTRFWEIYDDAWRGGGGALDLKIGDESVTEEAFRKLGETQFDRRGAGNKPYRELHGKYLSFKGRFGDVFGHALPRNLKDAETYFREEYARSGEETAPEILYGIGYLNWMKDGSPAKALSFFDRAIMNAENVPNQTPHETNVKALSLIGKGMLLREDKVGVHSEWRLWSDGA